MFSKVRFVGCIVILYVAGIGGIFLLAENSSYFKSTAHAEPPTPTQRTYKPIQSRFALISGKPIRITIPESAIDLPVDDGYYNEETGEWTLSENRAQFAMMTTLANNLSGNTFIYGHGTDAVFGKIGNSHPQLGAQALVYTDNNHILSYRFQEARDITPNDTSILYDTTSSPSTLTIQTCSGVFNEWRTMFRFTFEKVVQ